MVIGLLEGDDPASLIRSTKSGDSSTPRQIGQLSSCSPSMHPSLRSFSLITSPRVRRTPSPSNSHLRLIPREINAFRPVGSNPSATSELTAPLQRDNPLYLNHRKETQCRQVLRGSRLPSLSARSSNASVRGRSQLIDFPVVKPLRRLNGVRAGSHAFMAIHGIRHGMTSGIHGIGGSNAE